MSVFSEKLDAGSVASILARVARRQPRVHCLTNTVAQNVTANMLLAFGAVPSMASHLEEIRSFAAGAGAILINLGTISAEAERAIPELITVAQERRIPLVLDPVFVEHSPLRLRLVGDVLSAFDVLVRGNATEMATLEPLFSLRPDTVRVTTGAVDRVETEDRALSVAHGHVWMTQVTGLGCASSALVAACRAVEPDPVIAAGAALTAYGIAGEIAAERSAGPGSFAMHLIDALAGLDEATLAVRMG